MYNQNFEGAEQLWLQLPFLAFWAGSGSPSRMVRWRTNTWVVLESQPIHLHLKSDLNAYNFMVDSDFCVGYLGKIYLWNRISLISQVW